MGKLFGEDQAKGIVRVFEFDKGIDAKSIVHIGGFTDKHDAYLVEFSAANQERLALMPCFGKRTYIFAYGHDLGASRSSCTVVIFLGTKNCKPGDNTNVVGDLMSYYIKNRISETGDRQTFSLCGEQGFASGYLIAMQVNSYNPDLNAVSATVTYMTTPPKK